MSAEEGKPVTVTVDEAKKRRQRNIAIGALIVFFVIVVYAVTILRIGGNIATRTL